MTLVATPDEGCTFVRWVGDVAPADKYKPRLPVTMDAPKRVVAIFDKPGATPRNFTFDGSGDWFDRGTWDGVAIPTTNDTVTVTGDATLPLAAEVDVGNLVVSAGTLSFGLARDADAKLAVAGDHGIERTGQEFPIPAVFERLDALNGGAAGGADHFDERLGINAPLGDHLCAPARGGGRDFERRLVGESRCGSRTGDEINVLIGERHGRTRERGECREEFLPNTESLSDRPKHRFGGTEMFLGRVLPAAERDGGIPHHGVDIRHDSHDGRARGEIPLIEREVASRGDGNDELSRAHEVRDGGEQRGEHLRLDGKEHRIGCAEHIFGCRGLYAVP